MNEQLQSDSIDAPMAFNTMVESGSSGPPVLAPTAAAGSAEEPGARGVGVAVPPPPRPAAYSYAPVGSPPRPRPAPWPSGPPVLVRWAAAAGTALRCTDGLLTRCLRTVRWSPVDLRSWPRRRRRGR